MNREPGFHDENAAHGAGGHESVGPPAGLPEGIHEEGGGALDGFHSDFHSDWADGLSEAELELQYDLSCLVDDELDEAAAARVMVQMEDSPACQAFFEDARRYVRLHRDLADPERLEARLATLSGAFLSDAAFPSDSAGDVAAEAEKVDLHHRLATIFYQLGKAYVLAGVDPDAFRARVFEAAVQVEPTKTAGRGFVDGVILGGKAETGLNWRQARHLLNGRLERIEGSLEKGRRLLQQALETDPTHEEAKLYLAFLHAHEGRKLQAADLYRDVFDTALCAENRGHAANQLGQLHSYEDDWRRALVCWRWLTIHGLAQSDDRFWMTPFNIGVAYAHLGDRDRSLRYFRWLLDAHPGRVADVAEAFANPAIQTLIDSQAGFPEALVERCPELFQSTPPGGSPQ